jgi:hypothetical protein
VFFGPTCVAKGPKGKGGGLFYFCGEKIIMDGVAGAARAPGPSPVQLERPQSGTSVKSTPTELRQKIGYRTLFKRMPNSKREDLNWGGLVSECRSMLECALATEVEANALLRKRSRYKFKLAEKPSTSRASLGDWFGAIISETDLLLFIRTRRERIG